MIWRNGGVYYTCQRTNHKWPVDDMSWDNGLLVRNESKDNAINGSLELAWAREAQRTPETKELQPVPKLIQPVDPKQQMNTLPATSGSYGGH